MKNNTKQLIMDTAWKHFSKYGYTDTNLERICKEAGITRGPLYYYFADKEDLYRQVMVQEVEKMDKEYTQIFACEEPLMETIQKQINLSTIYNPLLQRANADNGEIPKVEEVAKLSEKVLKQTYEKFQQAARKGELKEGTDILKMIYFLYTYYLGIVTFDEKINVANQQDFYDKTLAIQIFLDSFRQQFIK